jgi:hypothetical protein
VTAQHFWPCELSFPLTASEIRFLETALENGYRPFVTGISDLGALSDSGRSGELVVRGRTRRELVLSITRKTVLSAFVDEFETAADALLQWLEGASIDAILEMIRKHLIVMPGMTTSYQIYSSEPNRVAN